MIVGWYKLKPLTDYNFLNCFFLLFSFVLLIIIPQNTWLKLIPTVLAQINSTIRNQLKLF